jgi:hypothetical protein
MFDPLTVPIQGDLSRNDVVVLHELCQGGSVVEFGMGGSTLLISRIANSLTSYDTNQEWLDRTRKRLMAITDKTCEPDLHLISDTPSSIPECDVLFIDGLGDIRWEWMRHFRAAKVLVCHDSLGDTGGNGPTVYNMMGELFRSMENVELLDRAYYHYKDSNMVVVFRRDKPIKYVNWNAVETENRLDPRG